MTERVITSNSVAIDASTFSVIRPILWGLLVAYMVFPLIIGSQVTTIETMSISESDRNINQVFKFDASFVNLILTSDSSASGDVDAKIVLEKLSDVGFSFPEKSISVDAANNDDGFIISGVRIVKRSAY